VSLAIGVIEVLARSKNLNGLHSAPQHPIENAGM
jgi:hypothetical protein